MPLSEERFRLLIDGVKDYAIFMLDVDGHVTSWNEGAKRLKGWDEQENQEQQQRHSHTVRKPTHHADRNDERHHR